MSAAISPACAFISGKSGKWIEICSGMNVTKIQIDDDEIPDMTAQTCEFCFQHIHMNGIETGDVLLLTLSKNSVFIGGFINEATLIRFHKTNHSRAPPVFS